MRDLGTWMLNIPSEAFLGDGESQDLAMGVGMKVSLV